MKVLVTGATGQLGTDILKEALLRKMSIVGTSFLNDADVTLNITDKAAVMAVFCEVQPNVVIHCAAYTNVDKAEEEQDECYLVNVIGTENVVLAAKEINATFLYISTDYVFNGQGEVPFTETDKTAPLSIYGATKLAGELVVQNNLAKWFIVRVSWLFGHNGNNFVKTMLRLGAEKEQLNIVADQIGSPTYTGHLAKFILDLIATGHYGIYHATNEGYCSWATFAKEIFRLTNNDSVVVREITSSEYQTKAVRPKNSRLAKNNLIRNGFLSLPSWQDALQEYINVSKQGGQV